MSSSAAKPLVCVVDDDVSVRESVQELFRQEGFRVDLFESAEGFLGRPRREPPSCLIVDLVLPGMSGLELRRELARTGSDAPTILLTGHGDIPTSVLAMKAGALDFFTKPYDVDELVAAVRQAVSRRVPERKPGIPGRSEGLVGESEALRWVLHQVDLVADTDATVLVTGESGTGKELVARAIHERSHRRHGPLVTVNCAAIPETLFESELFGHVKGAFTGAVHDRPGRFEAAQGGTLMLDEVAEVPLEVQAKLLRVLQEKEVERVGEIRPRKVDVRIVAATNRDLAAQVQARCFRSDLFYRLNVFPIENPPLRERREDIPLLAAHFVQAAARRLRIPPPRLTEGVVRQLISREWPGNIRELESAIERAVILADGGELSFDISPTGSAIRPPASATPAALPQLSRAAVEKQQRETIAAALAQTGGVVSGPHGAAALLGMKASTLFSRMTVLGLRPPTAQSPPARKGDDVSRHRGAKVS